MRKRRRVIPDTNSDCNSTLEANTTVDSSQKGHKKSSDNSKPVRRRKRRRVSSSSDEDEKAVRKKLTSNVSESKIVKCGVCKNDIQETVWISHIGEAHNYLAWKDGEKPLDIENEKYLLSHLLTVIQVVDKFICSKCHCSWKKPEAFMRHIKFCEQASSVSDHSVGNKLHSLVSESKRFPETMWVTHTKEAHNCLARKNEEKRSSSVSDEDEELVGKKGSENFSGRIIVCGVCKKSIQEAKWFTHIGKKHNYLAWKDGEQPLDIDNENEIWCHLLTILKALEKLTCYSCHCSWKKPKAYLRHIKYCYEEDRITKKQKEEIMPERNKLIEITIDVDVICALCKGKFRNSQWLEHIKREHNYLAWVEGMPALDLDDEDVVWDHLRTISKSQGGLVCIKCNTVKKYPKAFLDHVRSCGHGDSASVSHGDKNELIIAIEQNSEVTCGVCKMKTQNVTWIDHIKEAHNYLAWRDGEIPLDVEDEDKLRDHLKTISIMQDGLTCSKCNANIKSPKMFLDHVRSSDDCIGLTSYSDNNESIARIEQPITNSKDKEVICGVCKMNIQNGTWINHIKEAHNYLAWKDGDTPLDLEDEDAVRDHLKSISKIEGGLICTKCNVQKKGPKNFLKHLRYCTGSTSFSDNDQSIVHIEQPIINWDDKEVVCGVCKVNTKNVTWIDHIKEAHNYLAWRDGESPLDLENIDGVRDFLKTISKKMDGLVCIKCNVIKKYPKSFLDHVRSCTGSTSFSDNNQSIVHIEQPIINWDDKEVVCGVCKVNTQNVTWIDHIKEAHNYLAWRDGENPLDLEDEDAVRDYLKTISKKMDGLVCIKCNVIKKYPKTFLEHVRTCTGSNCSPIQTKNPLRLSVDMQDKEVKCGVCEIDLQNNTWIHHIEEAHNYLAWRVGETPLDLEDKDAVWDHLNNISKIRNGLLCVKCNATKKYPKLFLEHVRCCTGSASRSDKDESIIDAIRPSIDVEDREVTCGVCRINLQNNNWFEHIEKEHNYLAWKDGETPLDLEDEDVIRDHLKSISKKREGLICIKCNATRKYPKSFLDHVRSCDGTVVVQQQRKSCQTDIFSILNTVKVIKCGVCYKDIEADAWVKHIQLAHNYLAWRDGDEPLQLDDKEAIKEHLGNVIRHVGQLVCAKCSFTRRYAGYYIAHMETCDGVTSNDFCADTKSLLMKNGGLYECAVCHDKITPSKWKAHAMDEHYNIAWVVGDVPVDIKSPYGTDKYLQEYRAAKKKLVCNNCGESRASLKGFYVHVITCGKSEEEIDMYKEDCSICGTRYLGIYKTSHMSLHKEKLTLKQREPHKLNETEKEEEPTQSGLRRAAVKANNVIEKYKKNVEKDHYKHKCEKCGFGTDAIKHFQAHKCDLDVEECSGGSEAESESESETEEVVEEDIFDEPEQKEKVDRRKDVLIPSWLPHDVMKWRGYYEKILKNFRATHLTEDKLFSEWHMSQYNFVADHTSDYMPKVVKSCNVKIDGSWKVYEQFEGFLLDRVVSMFVGGSVQCISWAPSRIGTQKVEKDYLAVSAHSGSDAPRFNYDDLHTHSGLIQIWDVGNFKSTPKVALGIAHDYGTVWSMDWCPSGARDDIDEDAEDKTWTRLGLLAVACSNGCAYILSVPYPTSVSASSENLLVKLKPVAELRMCSEKSDRKMYQATAISWSKRNGHSEVVVGYADGSTARYDLKTESPLLKTTEDDITILYSYSDDRLLNTCVTDVDTFPGAGLLLDTISVTSPTGAMMANGTARPSRVVSHVPAVSTTFLPAWPSVLIAGDDGLVHQAPNELEWHGCARRVGPVCACAACSWCGRMLIYAPPLLRITKNCPPCMQLNKTIIASINVVSLDAKGNGRKRKMDELAVKVEPITYESAVDRYGVEFKHLDDHFKPATVREQCPERFPLADVTAMAYCTSSNNHDWAAVATHSGIIFMLKTA